MTTEAADAEVPVEEDGTRRQKRILRDALHVKVESIEQNLIDDGRLDSLLIVDLLISLEGEFALEIDLDNLEIEHVTSVAAIARWVQRR